MFCVFLVVLFSSGQYCLDVDLETFQKISMVQWQAMAKAWASNSSENELEAFCL